MSKRAASELDHAVKRQKIPEEDRLPPFLCNRFQIYATMLCGVTDPNCIFSTIPRELFDILVQLIIPAFEVLHVDVPSPSPEVLNSEEEEESVDFDVYAERMQNFPEETLIKLGVFPTYSLIDMRYEERFKRFSKDPCFSKCLRVDRKDLSSSKKSQTDFVCDLFKAVTAPTKIFGHWQHPLIFEGRAPLRELMLYDVCGCFEPYTLIDFAILLDSDKQFAIIWLSYDTESG